LGAIYNQAIIYPELVWVSYQALLQASWQPSAGSTFYVVSFNCNVISQWRTCLRCESMVGKTSYTLEKAWVELGSTQWNKNSPCKVDWFTGAIP
jgi:hypothetical protein